jgi:hypothetical protein
MNKPTAVIDKSLLQAICEQPGDKAHDGNGAITVNDNSDPV